ncbi:GNAT family N-acetyltransferase [Clostridium sp.]|uniref:GNAT family N-acetyltransferase n=1 Tax=Clostridium sp. TaxID=1506 RepID=UPI0032178AC2
MKILELQELNEQQIKDIRKLEGICKEYDGIKGDVFLSNELNFNKEIKCYFLSYEGETLISFIYMFMPTLQEAEVSAYTLPDERQKGYFKLLLEKAVEELNNYGVRKILFVHEPKSKNAKCVLKRLDVKYDFSEYLLVYDSTNSLECNSKLKLVPVQKENVNEIAALHVDIFNKSLEIGQSMVNRALDSEDRIPYMAKLNNEIIGIGSISLENKDGFICGLGISSKHQGKGYGKEILNLLIEKMLTMDINDILLEVDSENHIAYNLYTKSGFKIKTQFDYYRYLLKKGGD